MTDHQIGDVVEDGSNRAWSIGAISDCGAWLALVRTIATTGAVVYACLPADCITNRSAEWRTVTRAEPPEDHGANRREWAA